MNLTVKEMATALEEHGYKGLPKNYLITRLYKHNVKKIYNDFFKDEKERFNIRLEMFNRREKRRYENKKQ